MAALAMVAVIVHGYVNVTQGGKGSDVKSVNTNNTLLINANLKTG